jgi:AcrR family transcriptional regulator
MPRIDAPTVAEHHRRRRTALVEAGAALIAERGVEAATLAAVGAAAGLARSSVYTYFDSTPALVAAIVEDAFPRATERLRAAVAGADTPRGQVDAYLCVALELATDRQHRAVSALADADLPESCRDRLAELHAAQAAPLAAAVAGAGVADPDLTTRLLVGILRAAVQAVVGGKPLPAVRDGMLALVHRGMAG